ncbi:peptidylprolyl isomerase [Thalassolituus sp.]|jgi:peptidyl-prolyl cis-trans isomerase A (cyclophilin A)|uniref:peptidylprolyl isomerase n=1 Tax=Thalassolituus sp. TaxID=2030822 RepID=UPI003518D745
MRFFTAVLLMLTSLTTMAAKPMDETVAVALNTSAGYIELELNKSKAPVSVENFLAYVNDGHYNGTVFHRVIKDFMIQGGGFGADMRQKATRAPIENEAKNGLRNDRGTIAMARTSNVNSATSQFFINVKDNNFLNHGARDFGYAVFGRVVAGMEVVDQISQVPTGARDVPRTPVLIYDVRVIDKAAQENGRLIP